MSGPAQPFRTLSGGLITRSRTVTFRFDGRRYTGHPGDTLASALLANGVHLAGRSFKYHRPRGIMTAGSEEPNALVTVRRGGARQTPNQRATEVEIYEGLESISQNRWPSLAFDIGAISGKFAPLFPAGFYYKTFMGPRFIGSKTMWPKLFEPLIRRAAGLGRAPSSADPDRYANRYAHCDVLVIGAGPAGATAALKAASGSGPSCGMPILPARKFRGMLLARTAGGKVRCRRSQPMPASRSCRARRRLAPICRTSTGSQSGSPITSLTPIPGSHANGFGRSGPKRWCSPPAPSSGRWCFPATTARV